MFEADKVVIGRRGVHDRAGLVGYELLSRSVAPSGERGNVDDQVTADVEFSALSVGLDRLAGEGDVYFDASYGMLTGLVPLLLPERRVVLQVRSTTPIDDAVVAGCRRLVDRGVRLAVAIELVEAEPTELLELASIVKVDPLTVPFDDAAHFAAARGGAGLTLFATRVAASDDLGELARHGFRLFQGLSLDLPTNVQGTSLTTTHGTQLTAAAQVLSDVDNYDRIEEVLRRDPTLAYEIMELAARGRLGEYRRPLSSLRDALVLAGTTRIRNWIALLLLRPRSSTRRDRFAYVMTVQRARACELLAADLGPAAAATAFAAGMISALDLLFGIPIDQVAASLDLHDDLREAAFGGDTPLGRIVQEAVGFQLRGVVPVRGSLPADRVTLAFASALTWAWDTSVLAFGTAGASG